MRRPVAVVAVMTFASVLAAGSEYRVPTPGRKLDRRARALP
jgi:hypothetical protein